MKTVSRRQRSRSSCSMRAQFAAAYLKQRVLRGYSLTSVGSTSPQTGHPLSQFDSPNQLLVPPIRVVYALQSAARLTAGPAQSANAARSAFLFLNFSASCRGDLSVRLEIKIKMFAIVSDLRSPALTRWVAKWLGPEGTGETACGCKEG